jgi:hypothetical protein
MPHTPQVPAYGRSMSNTRYGHSNAGGGDQDQAERKDEGWTSRQGGAQSNRPGRVDEPQARDAPGVERESRPPAGTNTQGDMAGIADASREVREGRAADREPAVASGTDQPPRMGGPLGPDRNNPHLPEGAQDNDAKGTGAGGFDVGVDATNVGAVHQGARPEDQPD